MAKKRKSKSRQWYEIKAAGESEAEVLIYGDIGESWWGESVIAKDFVEELQALEVDTMTVRINSFGGSVKDGIAIYNAIRRHSATVAVEIDGMAVSIASLIAMAGDTVNMAENAMMMLHAPWGFASGNAQEMRETAEMLDKHADAMATSYARKTGKPIDDILSLLKDGKDHWYIASEALEEGLIDKITDEIELDAAASLRGSRFTIPQETIPAAAAAISTEVHTMSDKDKQAAELKAAEAKTKEDEIKAKAAAEALAADKARRDGVRNIAKPFMAVDGMADLVNAMVEDSTIDLPTAQKKILALLAKGSEPTAGKPRIEQGETDHEKFRAGAMLVLTAKAGLHEQGKRPDLKGNEFTSFSLMDMARKSLALSGIRVDGMTRMELVGEAFAHSTSDFPYILENTARKAMLMGYDEAPETFGLWTRTGNLADFKTASRTGLSEFSDLEEVGEDGEFKHGSFGDRREQITLATYGKLFRITRQAIINDDMNAFAVIPRKMGRAASRKVGDLAWGVLTVNAAMADSVALFHADHSNLAGSGAAPTVTTVGAARTAMAIQTDSSGNATLNIRPSYLLCPVALEDTSRVLMTAEMDPSITTRGGKPNPLRGIAEVVTDARLDVASTTAWYLAASGSQFDTVEVAYLDGNPNPFLDQQDGWSIDGVEMKVRIDAAAKALDHRTMYKNAGA